MSLIDIYNLLPYSGKVAAASLRGYYLRWWRYGLQTSRLVEEAHDRETWSLEKIANWQNDRVSKSLVYAVKTVPYYRDLWSMRRRHGDRASWELLENWPILQKKTIRENPERFISDEYPLKSLFREHTSGTTGTPLGLFQSREALIQWYALFEARWRQWNGVDRNTPWAILGGQMITPVKKSSPPYWVWNQAFHQLYLSAYHISPKTVKHYFDAMVNYGVEYLYGYPSSMTALAKFARTYSISSPKLKVILSNAEPLFDNQRELLHSVFSGPVRNTYGMSEIICGASECTSGNLHLWPEAGTVEILEDESEIPVSNGHTGRIIATGLLNSAMPLIRYEVGDRGSLGEFDCSCERHLQILESVEGRTDDVLFAPGGRKIGRLDPVFKADLPIIEAQIVQETINTFTVNLVPAQGFTEKHMQELVTRLQDRLGKVHIDIRTMMAIPRGPNGKFRAVISKIRLYENQ